MMLPAFTALAMYYFGAPSPPPTSAPVFWQVVMGTNPYYLIFAPYMEPDKVAPTTFLAFLGGCLAASGGLVGLATVRVRRVALRQAGRPAAAPRRRLASLFRRRWLPRIPGPSLDANPVAWREWHRTRPSWMMRIAWGLYAALGVLWLAIILSRPNQQKVSPEGIGFFNSFQVAVGLLLLSVGAATSLAEERVRGSLDVLLATPMSTRSILAGKFWGTFGQVKPVVFWPAVLSLWLLHEGGSLPHYVLMIGSILACGAVITSLGLALATWVSRLGRAVALCVAAYVVFSIGWPILIAVLVSNEPSAPCLVFGCPAIGTYAATDMIGTSDFSFRDHRDVYTAAITIWMVLDLVAAVVLFAATVSSFDRCLGRMPEISEPPRPPHGASKAGSGRGKEPPTTEDTLASL
jgi:ABC-type transport system involved in multi-copper enzyme maturation permease subunit